MAGFNPLDDTDRVQLRKRQATAAFSPAFVLVQAETRQHLQACASALSLS